MEDRWLIDFDSVLSDTFGAQIRALNYHFGTSYTRKDFTDWHTEKVLTEEEANHMWGPDIFLSESFQASCLPIKGGREALQAFVQRGDYLIVVSDRPSCLYDITRWWLDRHIGPVPLILTQSVHSKSDMTHATSKQDVVRDLKLTKTVDDAPHHATAFADMSELSITYLMDTPSNQFIQERPNLVRASSWEFILAKEREMVGV